jgi:SAM-dependent methyltransferase
MVFRSSLPVLLLAVLVLGGGGVVGCGPADDASSPSRAASADTTPAPDTGTVPLGGGSFLAAGSTATLKSDVPYIDTPQPVVDTMLAMAGVDSTDVVYDLGSGDGRIPIRAAHRHGARAVGIEIQPALVDTARRNARRAGVSDLVTFRQGDLFEADISEATVVTLYLAPSVNLKLRPTLFRELAPGTRVVSHDFDMGEWAPDSVWKEDKEAVYLWTIPETVPPFVDIEEQ